MLNNLSITQDRYNITCKLCHKRVVDTLSLDIPLIGTPNGKRAQEVMRILFEHLIKKHADRLAEGKALAEEIGPFLILSAFEHEDPTMLARLELLRASIFSIVRKNSMTDDKLRTIVSTLALDPKDEEKVNATFRALRDALCEIGEFSPDLPGPPLIRPV